MLWVIRKPRGQLRGVNQMNIIYREPYLVKVTTKGEGGQIPKILTEWFMDNPLSSRCSKFSPQFSPNTEEPKKKTCRPRVPGVLILFIVYNRKYCFIENNYLYLEDFPGIFSDKVWPYF